MTTQSMRTGYCCERGKGSGLFMSNGIQTCWRHMTDEQRALVADYDQRLKRINPQGYWPYGPNIDLVSRGRLLDWAEPLGLKISKGSKCLHWLAKGQCSVWSCQGLGWRGWADHLTIWQRDRGKTRVMVGQPYGLSDRGEAELYANAATAGAEVEIDRGGGWYGHNTTWVALWYPEVPK